MMGNLSDTKTLEMHELKAIYAIKHRVIQTKDLESGLDDIIDITRPVFIFDNFVVYKINGANDPEVLFARAIGRGRHKEADLEWGDEFVSLVLEKKTIQMLVEELPGADADRTKHRFFLGIPLILMGEIIGVLVFIRFGGPEYSPDQVNFATYVAENVSELLNRNALIERVAELETKRKIDDLQEDFIATITHELLTPLGCIKGYSTTLLREEVDWDKDTQIEFLTIIDDEADRLRELIDNLLDSSKLHSGNLSMNFQPLRLHSFLKDMVLRATSRDEDIDIKLELSVPDIEIQADPTRLTQVFDNLINNAVKYAPGSPIRITLTKRDGNIMISIIDRGPGIANEHIQNLFKRFYRVPLNSSSVRGSGLGLYICRQIVKSHGGEIRILSAPNQGTTINLTLPFAGNGRQMIQEVIT